MRFLWLVLLLHVSLGFPPPETDLISFCYDFQCVENKLTTIQNQHENYLVVSVFSHKFSTDPYLPLYLGGLVELFNLPAFELSIILLENPVGMNPVDANYFLIDMLPKQSIFVSIEHGFGKSFNLKNFKNVELSSDKQLPVLYHLNHEKPWITDKEEDLNFIFPTIDELSQSYSSFPLVLRNYYFTPLLNSSYYIPVGAPIYGFVLGNTNNLKVDELIKTPGSERKTHCVFMGRLNYKSYDKELKPILDKKIFNEPQVVERREMVELTKQKKLDCKIIENEISDEDSYIKYIETLASSSFIPCPSGNNPETFRHYEALEVGAIPLIVKPKNETMDFLKYDLWNNYPGPIFNNWIEVGTYIKKISKKDIDKLQNELNKWYQEFKKIIRSRLQDKLILAFELDNNELLTSSIKRNGNIEIIENKYVKDFNTEKTREDGDISRDLIKLLVIRSIRQEAKIKKLEQMLLELQLKLD